MSKPILYKANETDFRTLGLGVLADATEAYVIEERNGQFYLEMKYPVNGINFSELKNDRIIKADASHDLKDQRFKIIRITKPAKGVVTVYAEHVSNHTADLQLAPSVAYNGNAQQALNVWRNNIVDEHPFTVYSDITTTGSGHWEVDEVENARRALGGVAGSILDTYGGEYRFDNYHISLLKQRGNDNGIPIMYGKNLVDLEQEEEIASTYTSVYPYAIYHPEGEEEPIVITLPEHFIDSEHVDKYARRKIQKVNFTTDDIETVEQLRARTQRYIRENNVGVPKVNLRVKFVDLAKTLDYQHLDLVEEINLCDWVVVRFEKLGIKQRAKIIKTTWNVLLDRYEEIEVGETRASLSQSINSVVDGRVEKIEKQVGEVWLQANGKNRSVESYTEPNPAYYQKGDIWYRPIADGETEMYRHNGYMWEFILSTADTTKNARDIAEQQQHIEDAQQKANEAVEQINTAVANAGFTSLDETLSSIQTISSNAEANAQAALGTATNAFTDAQTAIANAQEAVETTQGINVRVDEVEGTLALKADAQMVDTLTGIVETHGLDIQANAEELALKANQDTVDTLAGTVQSLGTEFDIVAGQVNSRVWNTDIETAIDDIEIGGRNWVVRANELDGMWIDTAGDVTNGRNTAVMRDYIQVEPGETLTFTKSHSELSTDAGFWRWRWFDENEDYISRTANSSNEFQWVVPSNTYYIQVSYPVDSYPKIEKGTKATDWTPAPEDTLARFDHIETEWTQTFDEFSQTVSSIDGRVTSQKQTIDSITQTVADHTGKIATVEQNVNGIQQTVSDPVNGLVTQVSTLANGFNVLARNQPKNKIENGDFSNGTSGWSRGADISFNRVLENRLEVYLKSSSESTTGTGNRFWTSGRFASGKKYNITFDARTHVSGRRISVGQYGGNMTKVALSTAVETYEIVYEANTANAFSIFIHDEGTYEIGNIKVVETNAVSQAQLSVLNDNINLRVTKGELLSQINIEAGRTLIQSDKLLLNANNTVITGTSWLDGAVIANASIDGAKIQDATIGSAKIASLDVNKLSGNISNFMRTSWNSATGGNVSITGSGILSKDNTNSQTYIQNGVIGFRTSAGHGLGYIGVSQSGDRTNWNHDISNGSNWLMRYRTDAGSFKTVFEYASYNDRLQTGVGMSMGGKLTLNNNGIDSAGTIQLNGLEFLGSSGQLRPATNGRMRHDAYSGYQFYLNNYIVFSMDRNHASRINNLHMHGTLNMNGYNITNQSDERLKTNIINHEDSSLDKINEFNFVDFKWIKDSREDFGVVAQQVQQVAPELILEGSDGYLSVNNSLLNMMTTHAVKELAHRERNTNQIASQALQATETNESKIHKLQQELSKANRRIEELEGAI